MSSNVGLTTPRGSGTSGYVQRNLSTLKSKDSGYGSTGQARYSDDGPDTFRQRQPDRQILEHDRRRQIEVQLVEERDRLEEENEKIDEENEKGGDDGDKSDGTGGSKTKEKRVKLSDDEIDERIEVLRKQLTEELEDEQAGYTYPHGKRKQGPGYSEKENGPKGRKQFKAYQVHEQAEAKIQETERLRKALGIKEDGEGDPPKNGGRRPDRRDERYRDRDDPRDRDSSDEDRR